MTIVTTIRPLSYLALLLLAAGCGSVAQNDDTDDGQTDQAVEGLADADADGDAGADGDADDVPEAEGETSLPSCGDGVHQDGEECDDGNGTVGDGCESDCRFSCHEDDDCDDGDACTTDECSPVPAGRSCTHGPAVAGTSCDDGNRCTVDDACNGTGFCVPGSNTCDCLRTDDCATHEDGDPCNGTLICDEGSCVVDAATVVICDGSDDTDCRHSQCDPDTGDCALALEPVGTLCADELYCNGVESCDGEGNCRAATVPCPVEGCIAGCEETTNRCLGAASTVVCRPATGPCNPAEHCNGTLHCPADAYLPEGAACEDGLSCSDWSVCRSGVCVAEEQCDALDNDCDAATDEGTGCLNWSGAVVCPEATGTTSEGCGASQCHTCTCTARTSGTGTTFSWTSCTPCTATCPG